MQADDEFWFILSLFLISTHGRRFYRRTFMHHVILLNRLSQIIEAESLFWCVLLCWCVTFDRPSNAHELNKLRFLSFRRSSIGTFIRSHPSSDSSASSTKPKKEAPPKLDYRSMVSIDDMPALFVSFDSKLQTNQKIFFITFSKVHFVLDEKVHPECC